MTVITGGRAGGSAEGTATGRAAANTDRIVAAVLDCIGRWGPQKTTVEDVARAAGLSRATVYRIFPGGKPAMLHAALHSEVARLVDSMAEDLDRARNLEDCLAVALSSATRFLRSTDALQFMREHEFEGVETLFAFDRLDGLLAIAANVLGPVLSRHVADPVLAAEVAEWGARIVVSYLSAPADRLDLAEEADARRLVTTYLMPGLVPVDTPEDRPAQPASSGPARP
jgi:AcrR family transcriptional regulator